MLKLIILNTLKRWEDKTRNLKNMPTVAGKNINWAGIYGTYHGVPLQHSGQSPWIVRNSSSRLPMDMNCRGKTVVNIVYVLDPSAISRMVPGNQWVYVVARYRSVRLAILFPTLRTGISKLEEQRHGQKYPHWVIHPHSFMWKDWVMATAIIPEPHHTAHCLQEVGTYFLNKIILPN